MTGASTAGAASVTVVAVGNRFGSDDGVAARVVDAARAQLPAGVSVREVDGEPTRVLDSWDGVGAVVLVDAMRSGRPLGAIVRIVAVDRRGALCPVDAGGGATHGVLPEPDGTGATTGTASLVSSTSSHGAGVAGALALGAALGRLPDSVVVLAVEGAEFGPGPELTPAVAAAVPAAVEALLAELRLLVGSGRCA